jgi:hypothetical protein
MTGNMRPQEVILLNDLRKTEASLDCEFKKLQADMKKFEASLQEEEDEKIKKLAAEMGEKFQKNYKKARRPNSGREPWDNSDDKKFVWTPKRHPRLTDTPAINKVEKYMIEGTPEFYNRPTGYPVLRRNYSHPGVNFYRKDHRMDSRISWDQPVPPYQSSDESKPLERVSPYQKASRPQPTPELTDTEGVQSRRQSEEDFGEHEPEYYGEKYVEPKEENYDEEMKGDEGEEEYYDDDCDDYEDYLDGITSYDPAEEEEYYHQIGVDQKCFDEDHEVKMVERNYKSSDMIGRTSSNLSKSKKSSRSSDHSRITDSYVEPIKYKAQHQLKPLQAIHKLLPSLSKKVVYVEKTHQKQLNRSTDQNNQQKMHDYPKREDQDNHYQDSHLRPLPQKKVVRANKENSAPMAHKGARVPTVRDI